MNFFVTLSLVNPLSLPIDPPGNFPRTVRVIIVSQEAFTVQATDSGPLVEQTTFQNYETLYGLLRDIRDDYANTEGLPFQMGNRQVALDYIQAFRLLERVEAYQAYSGEVIAPQLLDQFPKLHPGMEHLGGVPKGGTFILVYADDSTLQNGLVDVRSSPDYQQRVDDIQTNTLLPTGRPR